MENIGKLLVVVVVFIHLTLVILSKEQMEKVMLYVQNVQQRTHLQQSNILVGEQI